jgi:hypothetical protein
VRLPEAKDPHVVIHTDVAEDSFASNRIERTHRMLSLNIESMLRLIMVKRDQVVVVVADHNDQSCLSSMLFKFEGILVISSLLNHSGLS